MKWRSGTSPFTMLDEKLRNSIRNVLHRAKSPTRSGTRAVEPLFVPKRSVYNLDDCFFYHTMELPSYGVVRGHWDLRGKFDEYISCVEVSGKSVLDIGTATGFLSFEAEKRGASLVVSHDMS